MAAEETVRHAESFATLKVLGKLATWVACLERSVQKPMLFLRRKPLTAALINNGSFDVSGCKFHAIELINQGFLAFRGGSD